MKYVITAKGLLDVNTGNGSFSGGTPVSQTECATELIITRLEAINLFKQGLINSDTCVVTLPERRFLYENIFTKTEVYNPSKVYKDCIDLVSNESIERLCKKLPYKPFYKYFDRDKKEILDIPLNKSILNMECDQFLICIPRLKNSDTRRNLEQNYWENFIKKASKIYSKVCVFGKGNQNLDNGKNIVYIDTLKDYCSYLHHPNCAHVVSTISGPCHYAQSFSNTGGKTLLTMIDNYNLIEKHGDDPSYFHPCINFTNIKINFIKKVPTVDELLETLEEKW